jgi:hypothetical protein
VRPPKPPEWRRWLGIVLRAAHIAGVVLLGASLLGAPLGAAGAGLTLASGLALLASELADRRVALSELAGAVVLLKLGLVALMLAWPAAALPLFWALLVLSALVSHAPKGLRHWSPRRR